MAKKSSGTNAAVTMQKLANQTQITLQKMVNSANALQSKYNADEAQKGRDWQTQMSKTAHQMEVEDLKKAGLNPVLSSGGSGAQSYTTSSASMTPESGASALSNVASSQLGAIGNMESARMTAAATKAAAAQAAAATRAAAAQSAGAQIYAADKSYKLGKYKADLAYKLGKYQTDVNASVKRNVSTSFAGILDKVTRKVGLLDNNFSINGSAIKPMFKNPVNYFSNKSGNITAGNFILNKNGIKATNQFLKQNGLAQNSANRKLVVQAFVFGSGGSINGLASKFKAQAKLFGNSKSSRNVFSVRPGFR